MVVSLKNYGALFMKALQYARKRRSTYKGGFLIGGFSVFLTNSTLFLAFYAMITFLQKNGNSAISVYKMALLYALSMLTVGAARIFSPGLHVIASADANAIDQFLTRPRNLIFQILTFDLLLRMTLPIVLWTLIAIGVLIVDPSKMNASFLALTPIFVVLQFLLIYLAELNIAGFSFRFKQIEAVFSSADPILDMLSKIPVNGKLAEASVILILANCLGLPWITFVYSSASVLTAIAYLGLQLAAIGFLYFLFTMLFKSGLKSYAGR